MERRTPTSRRIPLSKPHRRKTMTTSRRTRRRRSCRWLSIRPFDDACGLQGALAGVRYEKSTVTAQSLQNQPVSISWNNPTEFSTNFAANPTYSDIKTSYAEFLPNLDLSLQVLPDVLLRGSYSKTISRSDLTQMIGTTSVTNSPKPGSRTATAGNPGLLPYESINIDLGAGSGYYATRAATCRATGSCQSMSRNFRDLGHHPDASVWHHGPERRSAGQQGDCRVDGRRQSRVGAEPYTRRYTSDTGLHRVPSWGSLETLWSFGTSPRPPTATTPISMDSSSRSSICSGTHRFWYAEPAPGLCRAAAHPGTR